MTSRHIHPILAPYVIGLYCTLVSTFAVTGAQDRAPEHAPSVEGLVVTALRADRPVARFGDPLIIKVTLRNSSAATLSLTGGSLILKLDGWSGWPGGGSGTAECPLATGQPKGPIELAPGASVTLSGSDTDVTVRALGQMTASYSLHFGKSAIPLATGQGNTAVINFEVTPSELMSAAWSARTDAERGRVLPLVRELLQLQTREAKDWRERFLGMNTFAFLGDYGLSLIELALQDEDPVVRQQAMIELPHATWSVGELNAFLADLDKAKKRPAWAVGLTRSAEAAAEEKFVRLALAGLDDADARVRVAAINGLRDKEIGAALEVVKKLAGDGDASVRSAAQGYLSKFGGDSTAADTIVEALADKSAEVKAEALGALEHSPEPPPLAALKRAFAAATGEAAIRLMRLLFEQENADLPKTFLDGFKARTPAERLTILTLIAGHIDRAALDLVTLGLQDSNTAARKAALMRLLAFPKSTALPLLQSYATKMPESLQPLTQSVRLELENRSLFPFLGEASDHQASAVETTFPSRNGTVPMVSPDGRWLAYVEIGWGRAGGSGGMGRSNLLSLTHAVRLDGTGDRLVSDMFLVGWLADSRRIATSRDGFAAICDTEGKVVTEFGQVMEGKGPQAYQSAGNWQTGGLRQQMGSGMPHRKRLLELSDFEFGEDSAFSPDGAWFGPMIDKGQAIFMGANDQRFAVKLSRVEGLWEHQATWSPDGKYVLLMNRSDDDEDQRGAALINAQTRTAQIIRDVDTIEVKESWDYRKARWNPWSKDGAWLALIRKGQVWIMKPDGSEQRQITFDGARKAFPTFSRDGQRLAYLTWQPDERQHYTRSGPTDLWIADLETGLTARVTAKSPGRIYSLDWLDDFTIIFDRMDGTGVMGYNAELKRLSLLHK